MNKKKNIFYVLYHFPKLSETFILSELIYLKQKDEFDIHILAFNQQDMDFDFLYKKDFLNKTIYMISWGKKVSNFLLIVKIFLYYLIKKPVRLLSSFQFLPYKRKYYSLFITALYFSYKIEKYKNIHLHSPFSSFQLIVTQIMAYLLNCSYSFTDQAADFLKYNPFIFKAVYNAKFIISSTSYNKNLLVKYSKIANRNKIKVIYCAVNPEKFKRTSKYSLLPLKILTVARLIPEKGLIYLLMALKKLKKKIDFQCDIIGDGILLENLKNYVLKNKLNKNINFHGKIENDRLIEHYNKASLFILPSIKLKSNRSDSQPVVLKEAMSMEIPVISTSIAGIPELIKDKKNGFLVPQKNPLSIYNLIIDIINGNYDLDKIRKNARQTIIRDFNLEKEFHKLDNLLKRL